MPNLNKVMLIGNLTRDPELRYTPGGTAVTDFGLAINRRWTAQNGEKKEEVCFVDCQAWARSAEIISEYCKKGVPLFVEGRLRLDNWEGRDGQKHSRIRVVVEGFQLLGAPIGPRKAGAAAGRGAPAPAPAAEAPSAGGPPPEAEPPAEAPFKVDDDIPF
jgi:single-strand DNA-binding protein